MPDPQPHGLEIALSAARRLAALVRPDGRFLYRYDADRGRPLSGYNVVRHCGSVWAMNLAAMEGEAAPDVAAVARRAMSWIESNALVSWERGAAGVAEAGTIKLGANALAILALVSLRDFAPRDASLARALCTYIRQQWHEGGDFVHKRDVVTGEVTEFRSDYYTGEALFALLAAAEALADRDLLDFAKGALAALAARDYGISQQSHWMMYAVECCQRLAPDALLGAYAERLADDILARPDYRPWGRCTPIACRTEALLAYLHMKPPTGRPESERRRRARDAVEENLILQRRDRLADGAFRRGIETNEVRIDYLQHNLVAFLRHARLCGVVTRAAR